jgi:hypothetical protein
MFLRTIWDFSIPLGQTTFLYVRGSVLSLSQKFAKWQGGDPPTSSTLWRHHNDADYENAGGSYKVGGRRP